VWQKPNLNDKQQRNGDHLPNNGLFGDWELLWKDSGLGLWFCDVKFQNWLLVSPISCPPGNGE
jgi:hypothetical protein